jgi:hypothetical protein
MLDDIVSELWRKENVTSGYCPRYRYTLIATLTLGNSYYICVDFLPTLRPALLNKATSMLTRHATVVVRKATFPRIALRKTSPKHNGGLTR